MKKIILLFTIVFSTIIVSCEMPGDFRDIELSIINAEKAHVYLNEFPGYKQVYAEDFDSEYDRDKTIHISNIPDGKYFLQVFAKDTVREIN
jgi:hypothetical protein